jgi:hypothetical protein
MRRQTNSKADGVIPSRAETICGDGGMVGEAINGSKARSLRLSRKRSVNPADGMLQPPRVAQFGEDAAAARGMR